MKILITGAGGQLGQEFAANATLRNDEIILWSREKVDICTDDVAEKLALAQPTHVINCAAYTAVDLAENHKEQAYAVNAEAVKKIALACSTLNIPVIHFSSDYVYHNNLRSPLLETDPCRPKGIYAKSKLKGEKLLLEHHPYPVIFRVSWLYSTFGKNFPKTIAHLASQRPELNVVRDQVGAPTYAKDLVEAVLQIIRNQKTETDWKAIRGVYNYSNEGLTNWFEIARSIVRFRHLNCQINPIPSREFPTAAPRPRYSKLNLSKFKGTFGIKIRNWYDALEECLGKLQTKDH
ncbi:MAG: dTDP-4-dehydrorhamnose reductase [Saprospiraceae bacterium]|nr:dTDP-4-dehydrorhamnose reductase [Saprospiraceae bacterium]